MHRAVVGDAVGRELDLRVGHPLPGNGHLIVQLYGGDVIVVAVALHAVPDVVIARVDAGGQAGGEVDAVRGIFHGAACHGARFDQGQGIAGIHQISRVCRRRGGYIFCRVDVRLEDGRGGGGGVGNFVVCRITRTAVKVRACAVHDHLLVRSGVGVLKLAGQLDLDVVGAHQVAGLQRGGHVGVRLAVILL